MLAHASPATSFRARHPVQLFAVDLHSCRPGPASAAGGTTCRARLAYRCRQAAHMPVPAQRADICKARQGRGDLPFCPCSASPPRPPAGFKCPGAAFGGSQLRIAAVKKIAERPVPLQFDSGQMLNPDQPSHLLAEHHLSCGKS